MFLFMLTSCNSNMGDGIDGTDRPLVINEVDINSLAEQQIANDIRFKRLISKHISNDEYYNATKVIEDREEPVMRCIGSLVNTLNIKCKSLGYLDSLSVYQALNKKAKEEATSAILENSLRFDHAKYILILSIYSHDLKFSEVLMDYIEKNKERTRKGLDSVKTVENKNLLHLLADIEFDASYRLCISGGTSSSEARYREVKLEDLLNKLSIYMPKLISESTNYNGERLSPLNYALRIRNTEMADWLLDNGANPDISLVLSHKGLFKASSLDLLMLGRHVEDLNFREKYMKIDSYLLNSKLDDDINDKEYELAKKIVEKARSTGLEILNEKTLYLFGTPLISAALMGSLRLVNLFIELGSDIFAESNVCWTFINYMICSLNFTDDEIIETLNKLEKDFDNFVIDDFINEHNLLNCLIKIKNKSSYSREHRAKLLQMLLERTNPNAAYYLIAESMGSLKIFFDNPSHTEIFNTILEKAKLYSCDGITASDINELISNELNKNKNFLDLAIKRDNLEAIEVLIKNGMILNKEFLTKIFMNFFYLQDDHITEDSVEYRILRFIYQNKSICKDDNCNMEIYLAVASFKFPLKFMKIIFDSEVNDNKLKIFLKLYSFSRGRDSNFYFLIEEIEKSENKKHLSMILVSSIIRNIKSFTIAIADKASLQLFLQKAIDIYGESILNMNIYNAELEIFENILEVLKRYGFIEIIEELSRNSNLPPNKIRNIVIEHGDKKVNLHSIDADGNNLLQRAVNIGKYKDAINIASRQLSKNIDHEIDKKINFLLKKFFDFDNPHQYTETLSKVYLNIDRGESLEGKIEKIKRNFLTSGYANFKNILEKHRYTEERLHPSSHKNINRAAFFRKLVEVKEILYTDLEDGLNEKFMKDINREIFHFFSCFGITVALFTEVYDLFHSILSSINELNNLKDPILIFTSKTASGEDSVVEKLISQERIDVINELRAVVYLNRDIDAKNRFDEIEVEIDGKVRSIGSILEEFEDNIARKKAKRFSQY